MSIPACITSFLFCFACIAFNAAAIRDDEANQGQLHAVSSQIGEAAQLPDSFGPVDFLDAGKALDSLDAAFESNPTPSLLLVEFSAFSCAHSRRAASTVRNIVEGNPSSNIKLVTIAKGEFYFPGLAKERKNTFDLQFLHSWIARNSIKHAVAMDSADNAASKAWGVRAWPTYVLVKPGKPYVAHYIHTGGNNLQRLLQEVQSLTQIEVTLPPNAVSTNVEIFLGKLQRLKNLGPGGCNDVLQACEDQPEGDALTFGMPLPEKGKYTVYGTDWCPHTRTVRLMLEKKGVPFDFVEWDKYGGKAKAVEILKFFKDDKIHDMQPLIFDTNTTFLGGRPQLWAKDGFYEIEPGVYMTQDIKYEKNGNNADVWYASKEYSVEDTSWGLGNHRLTAVKDVAEFHVNAELTGGPGFTAYALCSPQLIKDCNKFDPPYCGYEDSWLSLDPQQQHKQTVDFPGWHYLRHFDSGIISDFTFYFPKGMLCYALLLSSADKDLDAGW